MSRHANLPHSIITINEANTFNNASVGFTDVSTLADGVVAFVTPQGVGLSAAALATAKTFEILKVQKTGSTVTGFQRTLNPIIKSSVRSITLTPVSTGLDQIVNVSATNLTCNEDYLIKLLITNPANFTETGAKPLAHTYALNSGCCDTCEGCGEADCHEFWIDFKDLINADEAALVTAELLAPTAVAIDDEAIDDTAVRALGDGVCPVLRLTINTGAIADFCGIPDVYGYPNVATAEVIALGAFQCSSTVTVMQDACAVRHLGTDVAEQQFKYEGFYQGSIVRRAVGGERFQGASQVDVDKAATYVAITFEWDGVTESGFGVYQDPGATTIYVDSTLFGVGEPGTLLLAYLDTAFGSSFTGTTEADDCSDVIEFNP